VFPAHDRRHYLWPDRFILLFDVLIDGLDLTAVMGLTFPAETAAAFRTLPHKDFSPVKLRFTGSLKSSPAAILAFFIFRIPSPYCFYLACTVRCLWAVTAGESTGLTTGCQSA